MLKSISEADLFLFPSTMRLLHWISAEATTVGAPIICANASSLPGLLEDGGLYCDPVTEPTSIAECIFEAVNNPIDTVNRAAFGIAKILSKLSWQKRVLRHFDGERSITKD